MLDFTKEQEVEYQAQNKEQWLDIDFWMIRIVLVCLKKKLAVVGINAKIRTRWWEHLRKWRTKYIK
jgi:hypothetical protein